MKIVNRLRAVPRWGLAAAAAGIIGLGALVALFVMAILPSGESRPEAVAPEPPSATTLADRTAHAGNAYFDELGVEAYLAGVEWRAVPLRDSVEGEISGRISSDNRLIFLVLRSHAASTLNPRSEAQLPAISEVVASGMLVPPYTSRPAEFQGSPSMRVEGVFRIPHVGHDYRVIMHFFTAHKRLYMVGAGARVGDWPDDGELLAEYNLESVAVR